MAARRSYWSMYRRARARFDFGADEARLFVALFPFPYAVDIDRHPRIAARVAREVRLRLVREDVAMLKRELEQPARVPADIFGGIGETWEVTIHYSSAEQTVDVTVRILAPERSTTEQVKKAFWRFVNQRDSTYYKLLGTVDWRREAKGKVYPGSGEQASLADFKSLFFHSQIRVAPVEES